MKYVIILIILMSSTTPVIAEDYISELQRCIWMCLANSKGNTDPAYHSCVKRICCVNGICERELQASRVYDYDCSIVNIKSNWLNVRKSGSLNARIVGRAFRGSAVSTEIGAGGVWASTILNNGRSGAVSRNYLRNGRCGVVNIRSGHLNIRRSPTTRSRVIGKAAKYSSLAILQYKGSWVKVRNNRGRIGYVKRQYLKIN